MEKILREDGREVDNIRKVNVIRNYTIHAEGSVLISCLLYTSPSPRDRG